MSLNKIDVLDFDKYQITNCGKIFKKAGYVRWGALPEKWVEEKELIPALDKDGYLRISLTNETTRRFIPIHRMVALAFVEGRSTTNLVVNHINGIKTDNRSENLEWTTVRGNSLHYWKVLKPDNRGIIHGDEKIRRLLKDLIINPQNFLKISRDYEIPIHTLRAVLTGSSLGYIYEELGGKKVFEPLYEKLKILNLTERRFRNVPPRYKIDEEYFVTHYEISERFKISIDTVNNRLNNPNFKKWRRL